MKQTEPIEVPRVTALTLALAAHGAALLWLSLPSRLPEVLPDAELVVQVEFIPEPGQALTLPPPAPPPPPPPPPPPKVVEQASEPVPAVEPAEEEPATRTLHVHEDGTESYETLMLRTMLADPEDFEDLELPRPDQPASERLTYRSTHPPEYPPESKAAGERGWVNLRVLVDAEGVPLTFVLMPSTAPERLILAAIEAVKEWRFNPAMKDGRPVPAWVDVPIGFYNNNQPSGLSDSASGSGGSP